MMTKFALRYQTCEWIDFWTGKEYAAGDKIKAYYSIDKFPLYVKKGSVIPLDAIENGCFCTYTFEKKARTLFIIPGYDINTLLHLPDGEGTDYIDCTVMVNKDARKIRVQSSKDVEFVLIIKNMPIPNNVFGGKDWEYLKDKKDLLVRISGKEVNLVIY